MFTKKISYEEIETHLLTRPEDEIYMYEYRSESDIDFVIQKLPKDVKNLKMLHKKDKFVLACSFSPDRTFEICPILYIGGRLYVDDYNCLEVIIS